MIDRLIDAKVAIAEASLAAAATQYDRNAYTQIRDEYLRYAAARNKLTATAAGPDEESGD